ncbi:MAG: MFS transporter, partial [Chloroflexi bacterium]|nr:MFS transporter [Chloroflexota bacterium]
MSVDDQRTNTRVLSRENILSIYVPAIVLSLGNGIAIPAIPVFAESFGVSFGQASLVFIIHMVGGMASTLPTGLLVDRIGRRKVILAGPLLVAISSLLTATAQSFELLLLYRFIGGWAQQMWMLSRLAHIADTGGDRQRGRQITGMVGLDTIGRLLGPGVGGFLALWDIRAPFVAHGILSLLSVVPSYVTIRESAPSRGGRADRAGPGAGVSQRAALIALLTFPVVIFFVAQLLASMTRGALWGGTVNLYPV